jgi:hypothetical protein
MGSSNKTRIAAALAAVVLTCAIFAAIGPAANAVRHVLHHAFHSLSLDGRARAIAIVSAVPYWLPGLMTMLAIGLATRQSRRDARRGESQADLPERFGRLG